MSPSHYKSAHAALKRAKRKSLSDILTMNAKIKGVVYDVPSDVFQWSLGLNFRGKTDIFAKEDDKNKNSDGYTGKASLVQMLCWK